MIPLRFHFIWIGRHFPFVNRLAVESILQTHPGAEIIVHHQDGPVGNADWDALNQKVTFRPIDLAALLNDLPSSLQSIGKSLAQVSETYPAGRSNILRYLILYREGGIYLDFDTLALKSFSPLFNHHALIGEEEVFRCDDDRVAGKYTWDFPLMAALFGLSYGISYANVQWLGNTGALNGLNRVLMHVWSARKLNNAVLGSEPGNAFFEEALRLIPETNAGMRFALGPMLMNKVYESQGFTSGDSISRLDKDVFYSIPPSQTFRFFYGRPSAISEDAVAIHWCASNHKALAPTLTRDVLEKSKSLYARLAQTIMARGI